ncbi:MAG TPA: response regulator transcription factor [Candidatus Limnocylindria bacterium]|nr:response regulator transcription factor [Candidatus Limnocylindria bacterium]
MGDRILIVEDDRALRQTLAFNLSREGYEPVVAVDGEQGLGLARSGDLALILLDLMLPGMSGTELLRTIRADGLDTPVIILSAKGSELDRVLGLKLGADDYVAKPFSRPELLARIEAVLRRPRRSRRPSSDERQLIRAGQLLVDVPTRRASLGGTPLQLTTREFDLLAHLAAQPGRIHTREELLTAVWGYDWDGEQRTVDVHISWLRGKLRAIDEHDYFRTVRGVGYAFELPPDQTP